MVEAAKTPTPAAAALGDRPRIAEGLDLHETEDGLIVYQESTDRVHHLNNTAAVILQLCDGTLAVEEIAAQLAELFSLDEAPTAATRDCLIRLRGEGLVH